MTITYDTLGGAITVEPTGSIAPADLNTSVAIVGHFDSNAVETAVNEAQTIQSTSDADTAFGANSEVARQTALALANGAGTVYGVGVDSTEETETVTASSSGTLSTSPIVDPRVTSAELTVTDTQAGVDLDVEYVDATPSQPADDDTVAVNVRTGEWEADSSSDYEFTYETASYTDAIREAVGTLPRTVGVCTEADSVISTVQTELNNAATDFRFSRGVVGANPAIDSADLGSYEPNTDDWRLVAVAPSRGRDDTGAVRTVGAVAGLVASQPINVSGSVTYDTVAGLTGLGTEYTPSTAQQAERVTVLTDEYTIAEGVTTSSESAFADIYKAEIIDLVVEQLYERVRDYRGGSNARSAQRRFRSRLRRTLSAQSAPTAQPPLLASGDGSSPYSVQVSQGASDAEADVDIGIDPAPIAKTVNLDVSVGPVAFNGASV